MRKGFIVRQKSLSSLPSRQFSVNQIMNQKSLALRSYHSKMQQQSKMIQAKDQDISKLKVNLQNALKLAVNSTRQGTKAKQQSSRASHIKSLYQKKYHIKDDQYREQKQLRMSLENKNIELEHQLETNKRQLQKYKKQKTQLIIKVKDLESRLSEIDHLRQKILEIDNLTGRIKVLENNIRQIKLQNARVNQEKKNVQKQKEILQGQLKATKPYQQQLQQRIAYLQRVNLELQRKMQDFHKRQHQYKKQITHYKTALGKMTAQKNKYKNLYQETYQTLQIKLSEIQTLNSQIKKNKANIHELQNNLQQSEQKCRDLQKKLLDAAEYYKAIGQQNIYLKKRNKSLQQFEEEVRRTIKGHIRVADQANSYIISRNTVINGLQAQNGLLKKTIEQLQKKYTKLDKCLQDGSTKSQTQIKQSFYKVIRENDQLKIQQKQMQAQFDEKIMKYGQERDNLSRKLQLYEQPIPTQQKLFQAIISDKTQEIIMLEASNDQLIKLKKQQQQKIMQLQNDKQQQQKQITTLKLKAADLFRMKRQVDEAKKKLQRYQGMIQQQKQTIEDMDAQAQVLREKSKILQQRNFTLDLQNKNQKVKAQEMEHIMKQLDIQYLNAKKIQNQKNSHVLTNAVDKMQNGINALAHYFSCCYCGEILTQPITLALCGHNYCTKCKNAYSQYCYQCDTGQPIQKIFSNKYLKQSSAKYRFLLMVVKQAKVNLIKVNTTQ